MTDFRLRTAIAVLVLGAAALPAFAGFFSETVKGTGQVRTETRQVAGFDAIAFSLPGTVEVRQGASEGLTIEADGNLLALIQTRVVGRTLEIRPVRDRLTLEPNKLHIVVDAKQVAGLSVGGSGAITAVSLKSPQLTMNIGGSGSIDVQKVEAGKLEAAIGGNGRIGLGGTARRFQAAIGGSGDIRADKLMSDTVEVSIGGSGNAIVWAKNSLEAAIAGSGDIRYWGDPKLESAIVGSGHLRRLGAAPQ